MELTEITKKPVCVYCEHDWQKGYAVSQFDNCDNPFRLEDKDFRYLHFRTTKNCTFYDDVKGPSREDRDVYSFKEIFNLK